MGKHFIYESHAVSDMLATGRQGQISLPPRAVGLPLPTRPRKCDRAATTKGTTFWSAVAPPPSRQARPLRSKTWAGHTKLQVSFCEENWKFSEILTELILISHAQVNRVFDRASTQVVPRSPHRPDRRRPPRPDDPKRVKRRPGPAWLCGPAAPSLPDNGRQSHPPTSRTSMTYLSALGPFTLPAPTEVWKRSRKKEISKSKKTSNSRK